MDNIIVKINGISWLVPQERLTEVVDLLNEVGIRFKSEKD